MVQAKIVGATHVGLLVVCRGKMRVAFPTSGVAKCREHLLVFLWFTSVRSTHSSIMASGVEKT